MLKTLNAKAQRRKDARNLPALSASRGPHRAVRSGGQPLPFRTRGVRSATLRLCGFALNSAPSRSQTSAAPARSADMFSALGHRTSGMTAPLARTHTPGEFSARVITMLKTLNAKAQRRKDARVLPALSASRGPHRAVKSGKEKVKFWSSFATPTPPRSSVNPPKKLFAPVAELWDGQSLAMQEKVSAQSACPGYWCPPRFLVGSRHPGRAVGSKQLEMASGQPETRRTNPPGTKSEARSLPSEIRPPGLGRWTQDAELQTLDSSILN